MEQPCQHALHWSTRGNWFFISSSAEWHSGYDISQWTTFNSFEKWRMSASDECYRHGGYFGLQITGSDAEYNSTGCTDFVAVCSGLVPGVCHNIEEIRGGQFLITWEQIPWTQDQRQKGISMGHIGTIIFKPSVYQKLSNTDPSTAASGV